MEKNTRTKNILLVVLLVAVLTLSISYAALSQNLYINSQAIVKGKSTSWDVKFTAANCQPVGGYGQVNTQFSGTNTTVLSGLVAVIRAPGDIIECDITVTNNGAVDATLSGFTLQGGTLVYTDSNNQHSSSDVTKVSGKLVYNIKYASTDTAAPNQTPDGSASTVNDDLAHGTSRDLVLSISYPSTEDLPDNDVTVEGFQTIFNYVQK